VLPRMVAIDLVAAAPISSGRPNVRLE